METVSFEMRETIGILTINRPHVCNALNEQVLSECARILDMVRVSDIHCLIVTGAGDQAFVAGADMEQISRFSLVEAKAFSHRGNVIFNRFESFPVPVIAAVNGYALGGGCELALACDIRIASENAEFSLPEVTLGMIPGWGGMQRMIRAVGLSKTKEIVYTARRVKAAEALNIGLVNAVCTREKLLNQCMRLAVAISANYPLAIRAAKRAMNDGVDLPQEDAVRLETELFANCFATDAPRKAMYQFLQKKGVKDTIH